MAWRFKHSKYKNTSPSVPKREFWLREVDAYAPQSSGAAIAASAQLMAFVVKNRGGGSVAVLPLDSSGRFDSRRPLLAAHSDYVSDLCFSPFDDGLLATGSADCTVRVWSIPENCDSDGDSGGARPACEVTFTIEDRRVENLVFNPSADCLLTAAFGNTVRLYDILHQKQLYSIDCHTDHVQSITWRGDGTCLASTCRDGRLRVLDPRAGADRPVLVAHVHDGTGERGDSRVTWLGHSDRLLTTGFNKNRHREVILRDVRQIEQPLRTITSDSGTGVQIPLFDVDTRLLFVAGKGDTSVALMELTDQDPYFVDGFKHLGEQTKSVCLVPKRGLDVMKAEVCRLLQMTSNAIVPISYQVPRKTNRDFHADLFPDTAGCDAALSARHWFSGEDRQPRRVSLDPARVIITDLQKRRGSLADREETPLMSAEQVSAANQASGNQASGNTSKCAAVADKGLLVHAECERNTATQHASALRRSTQPGNSQLLVSALKPVASGVHNVGDKNQHVHAAADQQIAPPPSTRKHSLLASFRRVCKCRFIKGEPANKSQQFDNMRNLNKSTTNECDAIHANARFAAVLLGGAGGKVAVIDLNKPGRLSDGVMPCLLNTAKVVDFRFDPFDVHRIAVACDDGCVRVWRVPCDGLSTPLNEPQRLIVVHEEKLLLLAFHPLAADILAVVTRDHRVVLLRLDDSEDSAVCGQLDGHPDQIFSVAWSPCGRFLATLCKDGHLRLFDPRVSCEPQQTGASHEGRRGGRVVWALGGSHIITTGFDKSSLRQICLYSVRDISAPMTTMSLDVSPSILMCHYDPDTSTLFLTAKGDTSILGYEVMAEMPYLIALTPYRTQHCHQGCAFLPKCMLDVRRVEIARCIHLLADCLVPVSFTVPRVKANFFQSDLFPPTRVTWKSSMTAAEWLQGMDRSPECVDLCPADMQPLHCGGDNGGSGAANGAPPASHSPPDDKNNAPAQISSFAPRPDLNKARQVEASMSNLVGTNLSLEQDRMEGVAEEEWNE